MQDKRIARLARDAFLKEPLFQGFSDLRRNPSIRLQAILMSLFLMPFFSITSLLSNDREARTQRYKKLFGCRRKMVSSDSTFARVLKWLPLQESQAFLLSFLPKFERHDLLRKPLGPQGKLRRLGILDGSYMAGHWLVTLCLPGLINYPLMVHRCQSQGEELGVARQMMQEGGRILGKLRVQLWLLDALYFNTNTIKIARGQKAHVLYKFQEADFRQVTQDAQNLFQHFGADEEKTGWDHERQCRWKLHKTPVAGSCAPTWSWPWRSFAKQPTSDGRSRTTFLSASATWRAPSASTSRTPGSSSTCCTFSSPRWRCWIASSRYCGLTSGCSKPCAPASKIPGATCSLGSVKYCMSFRAHLQE
jgi:hypothetical protein